MSLRVLILETSGRTGQVALADGRALLQVRRLDETRRHARDLAPTVADLLSAQGWKPRDVQALFVSRGPGSYTGLRVGIMSAKTFAYATGCALVAIDTFAAIALQAADVAAVDVLADAQQDKVYVQRFSRTSTSVTAITPLAIEMFPDWLAKRDGEAAITGPGLAKLANRLPAGTHIISADLWDPQPASLLRLGLDRYESGARDDLWSLEPLYLRPSSAEEKWERKVEEDRSHPQTHP